MEKVAKEEAKVAEEKADQGLDLDEKEKEKATQQQMSIQKKLHLGTGIGLNNPGNLTGQILIRTIGLKPLLDMKNKDYHLKFLRQPLKCLKVKVKVKVRKVESSRDLANLFLEKVMENLDHQKALEKARKE